MSNGSVGRLATFEIGLVVGSVGRSECFAHQSSGGGSAIGSAAVGQMDGYAGCKRMEGPTKLIRL